MILSIFNCDNDLALANFSPGFTPPARIRQMMEELWDFPFCPSGEWGVSVWGWSPAVCHRLRQQGIPDSLLPTHEQLLEIRRLSSRERAVELLAEMREAGICGSFHSEYCTDEAQVERALSRWPCAILKAPWSGSGKGLRFVQEGRADDQLPGWCQRVLQQQGGLVVEPLYDKVHDLAMEFYSDGRGHVSYQGLSLFETHPNGAYRGNLLLPESEKQAWLDRYVPADQSLAVRRWLEIRLAKLIGTAYKGYLGVDMMLTVPPTPLCQGTGNVLLHPMVELNLRMTMGMVSVLLHRQLSEGFRGVFRLEYFAKTEELEAVEMQQQSSHSYYRRLAGGKHYLAYVTGEK